MTENTEAEHGPIVHPAVQKLRDRNPEAIVEVLEFRGELTLVLANQHLLRTAEFLRAEPGLEFDFLSDISVQDRFPIDPRFDLNYHLLSIANKQVLRLRVRLSDSVQPTTVRSTSIQPSFQSTIDTVTSVWPTANWHEREIFDLFGIRFAGHPDLRRILLPDDWEGYPLRRDYPVEGFR